MPGAPWPRPAISGKVPPTSPDDSPMTMQNRRPRGPTSRPRASCSSPLPRLAGASTGPSRKYLLAELPPLILRGTTGVIGAALLALLAVLSRQSLRVPPSLAAADRVRLSQCRLLDGADGTGAALAARQRGGADRLHHAGLGFAAGVADPRRAAETGCG